MAEKIHEHFYPILNLMVKDAIDDVKENEEEISCRVGCSHCCHLLIEVAWEEAEHMARWILDQPKEKRDYYIKKVKDNALEAKELFLSIEGGASFTKPIGVDDEIPDELYDAYFYEKKRPCPILIDGKCSSYENRPSPCRLHLVSSPPELCAYDVKDDNDYDVPERIEELREEVAPINTAICKDGRWGHFGILMEAALEELQK